MREEFGCRDAERVGLKVDTVTDGNTNDGKDIPRTKQSQATKKTV